MDKRVIEGEVFLDGEFGEWMFETDDEIYGSEIPASIDAVLRTDCQVGDRYRVTIEKIS